MITFTRDWHGYSTGSSISTLADTIEAQAVSEGAAVYGGASFPPNSSLDANNNVTGLVGPDGNLIQFGAGLRTVLFGDSHTDWFNYLFIGSSATFNTATRVLTITMASVHNWWPTLKVTLWNFSYASLTAPLELPISEIPTTTSFSVVMPVGYVDLPNGAVSGEFQLRTQAYRGNSNYVNIMQMRLGWPLNIVGIASQSGGFTTGSIARINDVLSLNPHIVLMNCLGINDQTYSGVDAPETFNSEETTIANNEKIFDAILGTGAYLIVGTIPPTTTGDPRGTIDICDRVIRLNDALWRYAQGKNRMVVFDMHSVILDPTSAAGAALASNVRVDNVHLSTRGAIRVAKLLEPFITNLIAASKSTLPTSLIQSHNTGAKSVSSASASGGVVTVTMAAAHKWRAGETIRVTGMGDAAANGVFSIASVTSTTLTYAATGVAGGAISGTKIISRSNNIFRNNLLATATGGALGTITGTAAAHIRCEVANTTVGYIGVASVAADDSGFGNKQIIATTACSADGTPRTQFTVPGTTAYATEMAGNGRSYSFECRLRLKSTAWANTPISDVRGYLQIVGSNGKTYTGEAFAGWDGAEVASLIEDQDWHVRTPAVLVPVGVTVSTSIFVIWCRHSAAISGGSTFTMELARPAVYDVTDAAGASL